MDGISFGVRLFLSPIGPSDRLKEDILILVGATPYIPGHCPSLKGDQNLSIEHGI